MLAGLIRTCTWAPWSPWKPSVLSFCASQMLISLNQMWQPCLQEQFWTSQRYPFSRGLLASDLEKNESGGLNTLKNRSQMEKWLIWNFYFYIASLDLSLFVERKDRTTDFWNPPLAKIKFGHCILNEGRGCNHLMSSATETGDLVPIRIFDCKYRELFFPLKMPLKWIIHRTLGQSLQNLVSFFFF